MKKVINARIVVKSDKIEQFIPLAKTMIENSNAETGCIVYKLYQEVDNPSSFIFYEVYKDQDAIDFHNSSEYLKTFIAKISELISEDTIVEVY